MKLRNYLILATVVLFAVVAILVAYHLMVQDDGVGEYEFIHSAYWSDKEEKYSSTSETVKEESSPINIDGKPGELWKGRYANGKQRYEHSWVGYKQHGKQVDWNDQGQMVEESHWKDSYLQGRRTLWYSNGNKSEEVDFQLFRPDGVQRTWYRSGQERERAQYKAGVLEGAISIWHPNGSKFCEAHFVNNRLHGEWQKWDEAGKLIKQVEFRNGDIVSEKPARRAAPFAYPGDLGSPNFAFVFAQGSGWHGYNTFKVTASGWCQFEFMRTERRVKQPGDGLGDDWADGTIYNTSTWKKAEFQLSDEMQKKLRDALAASNVMTLNDEYVNRNISDGTQWKLGLRQGEIEKHIYCDNQFPYRLRKLSKDIREHILDHFQVELLTASQSPGWPDTDWLPDPKK